MAQTPLKRFNHQTLWLLIAFFLALTYFATRNLVEKYDERLNARLIYNWTETSLRVNQVIHELQKERGLSSGLISSRGRYFGITLAEQRNTTDKAIADLHTLIDQSSEPAETLIHPLSAIMPSLNELPDLRQRIGAMNISLDVAVERYTLLIGSLFEPQILTMSVSQVGWIYRPQMAYIAFLQAKEMAGQERALIAAMLSTNDFSTVRMMAYYRIKAVEATRLEYFIQMADVSVTDQYHALEKMPYVQEAEKIRRRVAAVGASGRSPDTPMPGALLWFDLATQRINGMSAFEKRLGDKLLSSAIELEQEAHWALWVNALTILVSLGLAGGLMLQIWRGKEYAEAQLEQLRTVDPLTGLPNRDAWHSAVDQAVVNAKRNDSRFTILDIGLDRFRLINESLGHAVGDQVLVVAGDIIKHRLRQHDIAARPGGDRFSILLTDMDEAPAIATFCERILATFSSPIEAQGHPLSLSVSIGVALYPNDGGDTRSLLKNAETALHSAKEEGRACYTFYTREMNAAGTQLLTLERLLRQALANNEFAVVYQPQVDASTKQLIGVEALLRWKNPQLGNVSPVQFIPIAEATGLIVPIGEWVLRESCQQASRWRQQLGLEITVAVNLSARQFRREDLMASVQIALDDYALPARLLELEITEGLLMSDPSGAAVIMDGLRYMGLKIALDDFGTGYSSLAYLKSFPLDRLKLDRAFVKDLPDNESDKAIARAVIALGRNLGMQTLAEGVETPAQADFLAAAGCEVFQGYLYGKPMPAVELEAKIRAGEFSV
jgi:diguanylate cyclase (GGDEF)-like protein